MIYHLQEIFQIYAYCTRLQYTLLLSDVANISLEIVKFVRIPINALIPFAQKFCSAGSMWWQTNQNGNEISNSSPSIIIVSKQFIRA